MRQSVPKSRRITALKEPGSLEKDLQSLCRLALQKGAAGSVVIEVKELVFNTAIKRMVEMDDAYPSIHWPLSYFKDDLSETLKLYEKAVIFSVQKPAGAPAFVGGGKYDQSLVTPLFHLFDLAGIMESAAFYMGWQLSLSLAAGNCRGVFCRDQKRCIAMLKGRNCIHPYKSRPSVESAGIDAAMTAKKAGFPSETIDDYLYGILFVC